MDSLELQENIDKLAKWAAHEPDAIAAGAAVAHMIALVVRARDEATPAQRSRIKRRVEHMRLNPSGAPFSADTLVRLNKQICAIMGWPYG